MAWPTSARLVDYIANVTTITAATMNAIQDAVWRLIGGYRSVVKLAVDGTGNVDVSANPSGQLRIGGAASDTTARLKFTDVPVDFITLIESPATGGVFVRMFSGTNGVANTIAKTVNASWTGTQWTSDITGDATLEFISDAGTWQVMMFAATAGVPWNTAAWVQTVNLSRTGLLTAAAGVTATTGAITATAGNVVAAGTVVGSAGPGLIKGVRRYSTGTALTVGRFDCGAGWGGAAGADANAVVGTDEACLVTVAGSGVPAAVGCTIVLNYIDGTWTTAPIVDVRVKNDTGGAGDNAVYTTPLKWTVTATALTITVGDGVVWAPIAGVNYEFVIKSIGY